MQNLFTNGAAYSITPKDEQTQTDQQGFTTVQKGPKPIKVITQTCTEIENKFGALGKPVKTTPSSR